MVDMDRPREDRKHPTWLKIKRIGLAGLAILAIVLAVSSLPVLVLSFWMPQDPSTTATVADTLPSPALTPTETMRIKAGDIELYATLFLPDGSGPFPALVAVHGSGRTRGADLEQTARFFAENGLAVLVYDKRGVGRSGGYYSAVGRYNSRTVLPELANDVRSVVFFLRKRDDIRNAQIGLLGFSQAGWIVPIAAAATPGVAFTVLISGPTVTVAEEIYYSELTRDDSGAPSDLSEAEISSKLSEYEGPRGFDPEPYLKRLDTPGLWIFGERDRSIPVPESTRILERLITEDNKPFYYRIFAGGDHALRNTLTGARISFFPEIIEWMRRQGLME